MGELKLGQVDEAVRRLTTPFGGGIGSTKAELCGALSGGVMAIGLVHGRTAADGDKMASYGLAAAYRARFQETFGSTICQDLRDSGYGSDGIPCAVLAERAVRLLLDVLDGDDA